MQYIGFLMFVIGAAGVGGDDMLKAALICIVGLAVLGVSAFMERRSYDKASINSKRYRRNVQYFREQSLSNNKTA